MKSKTADSKLQFKFEATSGEHEILRLTLCSAVRSSSLAQDDRVGLIGVTVLAQDDNL
jgi:hypothetical protein